MKRLLPSLECLTSVGALVSAGVGIACACSFLVLFSGMCTTRGDLLVTKHNKGYCAACIESTKIKEDNREAYNPFNSGKYIAASEYFHEQICGLRAEYCISPRS